MRIMSLFLAATVGLTAVPALSHEFWISPQTYTVPAGGQLIADIRVGQFFEGSAYSFIPQRFTRFDLVMGDTVTPVDGRVGDRPALKMDAPADGLVTVVHQTGDSTLTWDDPALFDQFVRHKDFPWVLDINKERGIPETGFSERYSRYGKSLIAVGNGEGADREVGMETEIVALANPYTDELPDGLPVLVLYQGKPRADTQVEVFTKTSHGEVEDLFYRTDAEGKAMIPVKPGVEYLVDAVVMRELQQKVLKDPVWESLWASLTFRMPEAQ